MRKPERKDPPTRLIEHIKGIMDKRGLTQRAVSDRARAKGFELSHGYVGKFMIGQVTSPSLDRIAGFAAGLGVNPMELCRIGLGIEKSDMNERLTSLSEKLPEMGSKDFDYFAELIEAMDIDADRRLSRSRKA